MMSPPRAETFDLFKKIMGAWVEDIKRGDRDNKETTAVTDRERALYTDEEWERLCTDVWDLDDVKALLDALPGAAQEIAATYLWGKIKATRYQMAHYPIKKT